jgi:hypothetical protein
VKEIANEVEQCGSVAKIPVEAAGNTRNDMYLVSEAIRFLMKDKENDLSREQVGTLNAYKSSLDNASVSDSFLSAPLCVDDGADERTASGRPPLGARD